MRSSGVSVPNDASWRGSIIRISASLLDGGVTDDGLPYFVMEYLQGTPIHVYCQKRRLTVRERLNLFIQVCSAVDYSHRNLIVHRDLKAKNILVTDDGLPKLLDFGIAKLARSRFFHSQSRPDGRSRPPLHARLRQPRADPRRIDHYRGRHLFPWCSALRNYYRVPAIPTHRTAATRDGSDHH